MTKVVPLEEAGRQAVQPGMSLHLTLVHSRPNALIWEVVRRFWGTRPGLTLIANRSLFKSNTSSLAIRRGRFLRAYVYRFMEMCSPVLTESAVREAEANGQAGPD